MTAVAITATRNAVPLVCGRMLLLCSALLYSISCSAQRAQHGRIRVCPSLALSPFLRLHVGSGVRQGADRDCEGTVLSIYLGTIVQRDGLIESG